MSEPQAPVPISLDDALVDSRDAHRELQLVIAGHRRQDDELRLRLARCEREIEELEKRD